MKYEAHISYTPGPRNEPHLTFTPGIKLGKKIALLAVAVEKLAKDENTPVMELLVEIATAYILAETVIAQEGEE